MSEREIPALSTLQSLLPTLSKDGRDFERLTKWFLENDPLYRAEFRTVWLWRDWPERWGPDKGIDLIAERTDGGLVAVQAKHYAENHSITKADVDTFLSESSRSEIVGRLLVGTTDRVAKSALEVMAAQEKPVTSCLLSSLIESSVTWPQSLEDLPAPETARLEPRPHQADALRAIADWDAGGGSSRAQVIMACGTGKSLLGVWAGDQLNAAKVLVLVPTHALLRQTASAWATHAQTMRHVLRVCSDRAPDEEAWDRGNELSIDRTTDASVVASCLKSKEKLLVLCTYQSSPVIEVAMKACSESEFDLVIADEAHRCAGLEKKSHKTVLRSDAIRAKRRLFMTATPTVFGPNDRVRAASRNVKLASMDDLGKFGPVIYRLSFDQAVDRRLLCPYQVAVIPIEDEEIREMVERRSLVTPDGDHVLDAKMLATQVAAARAMRRFGCRRMVAFHRRIEDSKRFSRSFRLAVELLAQDDRPEGEIWSEHVDGNGMSHAMRAARVRTFKNSEGDDFRLLSNVRLLAEGVDVPGIDAISFVDSQRGHASVVQAVGRAVRPAPGKTVGTVVLPIVIRKGEAIADALSRSEHRHIVGILGALRSHDPEIVRSLDELRFDASPQLYLGSNAAGRFVVDAPAEVGEEFAEAVDIALTNALGVFTKRARRRHRPAHLIEVERGPQVEPDQDAKFLDGLFALERLACNELLAHIPDGDYGHALDGWWEQLAARWVRGDLIRWEQSKVANAVSWLAPEFRHNPQLRWEIAQLSTVDLPEQVVCQLGPDGIYRRGRLATLADEELGRWLLDPVTSIHEAVTHPGMPVASRLKRLHAALSQLSNGIEEAEQLPYSVDSGWPSRQLKAAVGGFVCELEAARVGEVDRKQELPPPTSRSVRAFNAGRAAAQPLLEGVRELRAYRYRGTKQAVRHRLEEEKEMDPDSRLDQVGWEIFLLATARGAGPTEGADWGTVGTLRERKKVRDDFLFRSSRDVRGLDAA